MASMRQEKKAEDGIGDDASEKTICPVCLEPQNELTIVGKCRHSCCTRCLSRHVKKMKQSSKKYTCPTCHGECGLGCGGEEAAAQGADSADTQNEDYNVVKEDHTRKRNKFQVEVKCQICQHRGRNVKAVNLCIKCDHLLYMCKDCTDTHGRNRATKDHVVVPLKNTESARDKPEICSRHYAPLTSYCCWCDEPACKICIQIDHGDHDIEKLSDFIKAQVEEVKDVIEEIEKDFQILTKYKKELIPLKIGASFLEEDDDDLMKDIDDHAQACIDEVIKLKEEFKADARRTFKQRKQVKQDVSAALDEVTKRIEKIQQPLSRGTKLVSEQPHGLGYLKQLTKIKNDLEVNALRCWPIIYNRRELFHDRIVSLLHQKPTFVQGDLPILGTLEVKNILKDVFTLQWSILRFLLKL